MVTFSQVTFGYGHRPLFAGLDLRLELGGCYGLLGLNGAGKTSLLKLAAGALLPRSGSIEVFGRSPGQRSAAHLAEVAFVAEDPRAPAMTLPEWLSRTAVFRPAFDREGFAKLCADFELPADRRISAWSYGQRKKFALAAALASGARFILLDEPTNGLDIPAKMQLRRALASFTGPDRILLVSTHQVRDLESLMDPIIVVDKGRTVFRAGMQELGSRLSTQRLSDLEGRSVVTARRDAVGWSALLAEPGQALDLELVFEAAVTVPARLTQALAGENLPEPIPAEALS